MYFFISADRVTLTITHIDLRDRENCSSTFLAFYDGINIASPLIDKYCSRILPHQITSQVNSNGPNHLLL